MVIVRKVRRVGNSLMIPLPPETLSESGFVEGMEVEISSRPGEVDMRPLNGPSPDLVEFAARFTGRYRQALTELAKG
ncbi:MAG TPA: AbrB/MazE/SpoVT family DNA-binding domain-containing protein [Candidatus Dormibacteraeota bacterium]|nr:AbrB/MazE/SpoVT family DNA-binding domain-containing protein [Candidatus Dormibacteraeota bacterium]